LNRFGEKLARLYVYVCVSLEIEEFLKDIINSDGRILELC